MTRQELLIKYDELIITWIKKQNELKDCFQTSTESSQLISGKINEKIQEVNEIKRMADELFDEYIKTCQVDALNSNKKIR